MSRQLVYKKIINSTVAGAVVAQDGDGDVLISQSLRFRSGSSKLIRLITARIPSNIPNICPQYNNHLLSFTLKEGLNTYGPYTITLETGIYTYSSLQGAINYAINAKMISDHAITAIPDIGDPPIKILPNNTLQRMYIEYDNSKMDKAYEITLDLTPSLIYEVLGFLSTDVLVGPVAPATTASFTGTLVAMFDYFGSSADVHIKGLGPLSILNGKSDTVLCSINLATSVVTNAYQFPAAGEFTPEIRLEIDSSLDGFRVEFRGSNGKILYFLDGSCDVFFTITETPPEGRR